MSMSNPATAARHFVIAREGMSIVIREIESGSDLTFTKRDAWDLAQRMAAPAKSAKDSRAKAVNEIVFVGLDLMRTVAQTFEATQERWEAAQRGEKPAKAAVKVAQPVKVNRCSDKQHAFITSLCGERNLPVPARENVEDASALIKGLLEMPKAAKPAEQPKVEIPAGHYAVDGEDGTLKFYKLDKPEDGKWAGYTFLKVQAGDDFHPIKGAAKHAIIAKIAADVMGALTRYGHELGKCGICNRTLTDEASRAAGIGPICAEKM